MKKVEIKIKLDESFVNLQNVHGELPLGDYECKLKEVTLESGLLTDTIFLHLEEPCKIKTHKE